MKAGDTFLIEEPGTSYDSHLWMLISDPEADHFVILVNFTTWRPDKDQACIVEPGEHSYISRTTCVNYAKARQVSSAALQQLLDKQLIKNLQPLSGNLLEKVRRGAGESKEIELGVWQILLDQGIVEE